MFMTDRFNIVAPREDIILLFIFIGNSGWLTSPQNVNFVLHLYHGKA